MSSSFSISDDDGARARYELDRARSDINRLRLVLWDEYFKAAIIATACSAEDVDRAAEIADAALAERVKRGGCAVVDWLSVRLGNAEVTG